jgi:hypothetical protein
LGTSPKAFCQTIKGLDTASHDVIVASKFFMSTMYLIPSILYKGYEYIYTSLLELYVTCMRVLPQAWDLFMKRLSYYLAQAILFTEHAGKQFMDIVVRPALVWISTNIVQPFWVCVNIFVSLGSILYSAFSYFLNILPGVLEKVIDPLAIALQNAIVSMIQQVNGVTSEMIGLINTIVNGMNTGINSINSSLSSVNAAANFAQSTANTVNKNLNTWSGNIQSQVYSIIDKLNDVEDIANKSTKKVTKWFGSFGETSFPSSYEKRISSDIYDIHSNLPCLKEEYCFHFDVTQGVISVNSMPIASLLFTKTITIVVNIDTFCLVEVFESIPSTLHTIDTNLFAFVFVDGVSVFGIHDTSSPYCVVYDMFQNVISDIVRMPKLQLMGGIATIPTIPTISTSQKNSTQISTSNIDFVSVVKASMKDVTSALTAAENDVITPIADACTEIFHNITLVYSAILSGITYAFQLCSWCKLTGQSCASVGKTMSEQGVQVTVEQLGAAIHYQLTGSTNANILNSVPEPACTWGTVLGALTLHAWGNTLSFVQDRLIPTLYEVWTIVYKAVVPVIKMIFASIFSIFIQIKDSIVTACVYLMNSYPKFIYMIVEHLWATFIWITTNMISPLPFWYIHNDTLRLNVCLVFIFALLSLYVAPWVDLMLRGISALELWTLLGWIFILTWIGLKILTLKV